MHEHVEGLTLTYCWDDLTVEQQQSVARQLAQIMSQLQKTAYHTAGYLQAPTRVIDLGISNKDYRPAADFKPFHGGDETEPTPQASKQTIKEFLGTELEAQRQKAYSRQTPRDAEIYHRLALVAVQMDNQGFFNEPIPFRFTHRALTPDNIMITFDQQGDIQIGAIIGWDRAAAMPFYMGLKPPSWMWCWEMESDDEELYIYEQELNSPEFDEFRQNPCMRAFNTALAPDQRRIAHGWQYRIARELTRIAVDGIGGPQNDGSEEYRDRADGLIVLWNRSLQKHLQKRRDDAAASVGPPVPPPVPNMPSSATPPPTKRALLKQKSKAALQGAKSLLGIREWQGGQS